MARNIDLSGQLRNAIQKSLAGRNGGQQVVGTAGWNASVGAPVASRGINSNMRTGGVLQSTVAGTLQNALTGTTVEGTPVTGTPIEGVPDGIGFQKVFGPQGQARLQDALTGILRNSMRSSNRGGGVGVGTLFRNAPGKKVRNSGGDTGGGSDSLF